MLPPDRRRRYARRLGQLFIVIDWLLVVASTDATFAARVTPFLIVPASARAEGWNSLMSGVSLNWQPLILCSILALLFSIYGYRTDLFSHKNME